MIFPTLQSTNDFMDSRSVPVFNKNAYSSNGTVVVTAAAREVMAKNGRYLTASRSDESRSWLVSSRAADAADSTSQFWLGKSEIHSMHCVVDGLRLIHRDQSHVKEVLAHCATLETYEAQEYVTKKAHERQLSCHFILTGSVQVVYEMHKEEPSHDVPSTAGFLTQSPEDAQESSIMYTHGAGEYLAMLSLEGIEDGVSPASKIYTLEPTELLRIDTQDFHDRLQKVLLRIREEIKSIVTNPRCVLSGVPDEALDKILPHITKQRYTPHSDVIKQGDESNVMFCLAKGRCDVRRTVHVPEARRNLSFHLGIVEQHDVFCQECLLHSSPSVCTVTTTTHCLVLKINRLALEVVMKDQLFGVLDKAFKGYPSDEQLHKMGYQTCLWNEFKHTQIRQHLTEVGGQRLLLRPTTDKIKKRSTSKSDNYPENLRRFILKGANFEPVTTRIRSAFRRRPKTQSPPSGVETETIHDDDHNDNDDDDTTIDVVREENINYDDSGYNNKDNNNRHDQKWRRERRRRRKRVQSAMDARTSSRGCPVHTEQNMIGLEEQEVPRSCYVTNDVIISHPDCDDDVVKDDKSNDDELQKTFGKEDYLNYAEQPGTASKTTDTRYNTNFMRAAVMVTLKTNEIVKKAKAVAEKSQRKLPPPHRQSRDEGDKWHTSIHSEHDRLTRAIITDKERMLYIRNCIQARAKQRLERVEECDTAADEQKTQGCSDEHGENYKKDDNAAGSSNISDVTKSTEAAVENRRDPSRFKLNNESENEVLSLEESSSASDFALTPCSTFDVHRDSIVSAHGGHNVEPYVIPRTVSPRQSISKIHTKENKRMSDSALFQNLAGKLSTHTKRKDSEVETHSPITVRSWVSKTKATSSTGKVDSNAKIKTIEGLRKANVSATQSATTASTTPRDSSNANVVKSKTIIISRKAVRVRPSSAPIFNRKK